MGGVLRWFHQGFGRNTLTEVEDTKVHRAHSSDKDIMRLIQLHRDLSEAAHLPLCTFVLCSVNKRRQSLLHCVVTVSRADRKV